MSASNAVLSNGEHRQKLLGRRAAFDPADYPLAAIVRRRTLSAPPVSSQRSWRTGAILNQGLITCPLADTEHPFCREQGFCVGMGIRGFLSADPMRTSVGPSGLDFYHAAQDLDEWPGIDYSGTSVRGGMKVLQKQGRVLTYAVPATPSEAANWLLKHGTLVAGIDWTDSMFYPDRNGFIAPSGDIIGGHCLLVSLIDSRSRFPDEWIYGGPNSWGRGWNPLLNGRWRMRGRDFHKLIWEQWGELFAAEEVRPVR